MIEKPGDVDQFVFKATKGQVFDIHCYARRIRSPLDSVMYLGKKGGGAMLGADDSFGPDSFFRFQAPEDAEYVVWLIDQLGKGGPDYRYRIEVTPVVPQLRDHDQRRTDPAGNGRDVDRRAEGEPAGDLDVRQSGRFRRRTECRASAGCRRALRSRHRRSSPARWSCRCCSRRSRTPRLAATLAQVRGKPADAKLNVPSQFEQMSVLVLGQNNVNVWSRTVDRLAVAVTEECPYTIEIVEPKVPLVRGGSMGLKVRGDPQAGIHGADFGLPAVEPAGRGLGRRDRDSGETERGGHSHERRRRRRAADLEDRGQRRRRASPPGRSWSRRSLPT